MTCEDIACILIVCVSANHLGLVSAIESAIQRKLWIVDCPKCLTFWITLIYGVGSCTDYLLVLAISFISAYLALWLELVMGMTDYLFNKVYEKIYPDSTDNETAADPDETDSAGSMPEL